MRILLVGDSMAGSLGVGWSAVAARYGAEVINRGTPGCSLSADQQVRVLWYTLNPGAPCVAGDPAALLDQYRAWVQQFDPDVVVYLARSEVLDQQLAGRWTNLGDPSFDSWVTGRFRQAVSVLGSEGARVVLATSPHYRTGEEANGDSWPEDAPQRVAADNRIINLVGSSSGPAVSVVDLNGLVSPGGFQADVNGVSTRCGDGVHFTPGGGEWIGSRVLPGLVGAGRGHQAAAGPRPLLAVEAPPSWYPKLPCAG